MAKALDIEKKMLEVEHEYNALKAALEIEVNYAEFLKRVKTEPLENNLLNNVVVHELAVTSPSKDYVIVFNLNGKPHMVKVELALHDPAPIKRRVAEELTKYILSKL